MWRYVDRYNGSPLSILSQIEKIRLRIHDKDRTRSVAFVGLQY